MDKIPHDSIIQLSHLLATDIGLEGLEASIIDTLYNAESSVNEDNIVFEIQSKFRINTDPVKIRKTVRKLIDERKIYCDGNNIFLSPQTIEDVTRVVSQNQEIEYKALSEWIKNYESIISEHLVGEHEFSVKSAILLFVKSFFLFHGADSFSLISEVKKSNNFDIKSLIRKCLKSVDKKYTESLTGFLQGLFSTVLTSCQRNFCIEQINKAITYLSMVADNETKDKILKQMDGLTIYLDTPILYRLLNLQGETRYQTIKTLLDYCKSNNVKLNIFQATYEELKRRIAYDSRIIEKYPTPVEFSKIGYKCRTSENYISTFWKASAQTGIKAKDFNFLYKDLKLIITSNDNEIEIDSKNYIDNFHLEESVKKFCQKVSVFSSSDEEYRKTPNSIEHDAICLTNIEFLRDPDASSVINSKVAFLTTDWSLIRLQRYDQEYKDKVDLVLLPSQLMQLFYITHASESFYDAFLGLFSSSKTVFGTKNLNNTQIQEILGRVAMYKGATPSLAERVLSNQIIQTTFALQESEEEQFGLIEDAMIEEVESIEADLSSRENDILIIQQENIVKDERIDDLSKRLVLLEEKIKSGTKQMEDNAAKLSKYGQYYRRYQRDAEKKSTIKAISRIVFGLLLSIAGSIALGIIIAAIIPSLSARVIPCFDWIRHSAVLQTEAPSNTTIIGILIGISGLLLPGGLALIKPGYSKLKKDYLEKDIRETESISQ
jgi:hypothetical protein